MARTYAAVPFEYLQTLSSLSDAQFGRLIRWLLNYAATGEVGELKGREKLFQSMVQVQEDRFRTSYDQALAARSDKARKAAQKRWENHPADPEPSQPLMTKNDWMRRLLETQDDNRPQ